MSGSRPTIKIEKIWLVSGRSFRIPWSSSLSLIPIKSTSSSVSSITLTRVRASSSNPSAVDNLFFYSRTNGHAYHRAIMHAVWVFFHAHTFSQAFIPHCANFYPPLAVAGDSCLCCHRVFFQLMGPEFDTLYILFKC